MAQRSTIPSFYDSHTFAVVTFVVDARETSNANPTKIDNTGQSHVVNVVADPEHGACMFGG